MVGRTGGRDHCDQRGGPLSTQANPTSDGRAGAHLQTQVTELLGVRHPILLAPMGDTAGAELAVAVSEAGAMGLLGGGYARLDWMERELAKLGDARVGVGFITFALDQRPEALRMALEINPVAIQLSFGDPRPFVEPIRQAGALLICQVQTPEEVLLAVEAGADLLVAQGQDAGGHGRPNRATMGLVPSLVDQVSPIPVVAAGGIADGRGLAAALMLGAGGVTMGTRFMASTAAISSPAEGAALVASQAADTVRTEVFDVIRGPAWPAGHDGRAVNNRFIEAWDRDRTQPNLADIYKASAADDFDVRPLWAGEGLDLITAIETPAAIVESTVAQAVACLRAGHDLIAQGAEHR